MHAASSMPAPPSAAARRLRICVLGNSVGLKMRPRRTRRSHLTYSELLMRRHEVHNACRAGALASEQFGLIDDDIVARFPDVVILNFGIVELFHRSTMRSLNNLPILNYYNNQLLGRPYRDAAPLSARVARAVNALMRRGAALVGLEWRWLDTGRYLRVLEAMCVLIVEETAAAVVLIEVPPIPEGSAKFSRTTNARIAEVNQATRAWAAASRGRIVSQRLDEGIADAQWQRLMPDAIHFSAVGHRLVHALLKRTLDSFPASA
jgi:hypothetical protein